MNLCKMDNPEAHRLCAWMVHNMNRTGASTFTFDLARGPDYANLHVEARREDGRLIERESFKGAPVE